jgi:hypothetical protein
MDTSNMRFLRDGSMTKQEKRARLIAAYRKMKIGQRDALDKTVRDLAALPVVSGRKGLGDGVRVRKG